MSESIMVRRGVKLSQSEQRAAGAAAKPMLAVPPKPEVEGQYRASGYAQCPNCGAVGWVEGLDSDTANEIRCTQCETVFRVRVTI